MLFAPTDCQRFNFYLLLNTFVCKFWIQKREHFIINLAILLNKYNLNKNNFIFKDTYLDQFLNLCATLEQGRIPQRMQEASVEGELKAR